jgi:hypothetical protein
MKDGDSAGKLPLSDRRWYIKKDPNGTAYRANPMIKGSGTRWIGLQLETWNPKKLKPLRSGAPS